MSYDDCTRREAADDAEFVRVWRNGRWTWAEAAGPFTPPCDDAQDAELPDLADDPAHHNRHFNR